MIKQYSIKTKPIRLKLVYYKPWYILIRVTK